MEPVSLEADLEAEEYTPEATFEDIGQLPMGSTVPPVVAKVTFLSLKKRELWTYHSGLIKSSGQSIVAEVRNTN